MSESVPASIAHLLPGGRNVRAAIEPVTIHIHFKKVIVITNTGRTD